MREKVALYNLGAYHSTNMASYASLMALPSSRVSLSWAQDVLFPAAEARKRIVICMRSAAHWGLESGKRYKGHLFAPLVNRGGHLIKNAENAELVRLVQSKLR